MTIKDNDKTSQTYVSKEAVKHIEKVSEDKKSITFKLTLKDGTHFVGNRSRKTYDKLVVDQVTSEQSTNDGKIKAESTPAQKTIKKDTVKSDLNQPKNKSSNVTAIILFIIFSIIMFNIFLEDDMINNNPTPIVQQKMAKKDTVSTPENTEQRKVAGFLTGQAWYVKTHKSAIDDSTNVTLSRQAFNGFTDAFGPSIVPTLVIRCHENKTDVIVNWKTYLGLDSTRMTTRLDTEKAQTKTWSISSDNKAVFARSPIGFVKGMLDNSVMLVRITPYGENPETVEFGLNGLKEDIKPLREACGW